MIIPIAMAIHGVPLYPTMPTRTREIKINLLNSIQPLYESKPRFRISAKEGK